MKSLPDDPFVSQAAAWTAILAASRVRRQRAEPEAGSYGLDQTGALRQVTAEKKAALLRWRAGEGWEAAPATPASIRDLLDLYLPLCNACPTHPVSIGHLGQSLDSHIATNTGDSCYVTGPENILHMHRMRALCDAVIVGAATVAADDPRLTTRLVTGDSPLRVILDPRRRLPQTHRVFCDAQAPTLLVCAEDHCPDANGEHLGQAEILPVAASDGQLDLAALVAHLRKRGIHALFIEGGGVTVSHFLQAGLLQRLQVAVAPLFIGSGHPAIRLPESAHMGECLRPECRIFRMGDDVLFDCDLRAQARTSSKQRTPAQGLMRIR